MVKVKRCSNALSSKLPAIGENRQLWGWKAAEVNLILMIATPTNDFEWIFHFYQALDTTKSIHYLAHDIIPIFMASTLHAEHFLHAIKIT